MMPEVALNGCAIRGSLDEVRRRIEESAHRSHRSPAEIKLIGVTKTHPPEVVERAIAAGLTDLGENRLQEAESKILTVGRHRASWHLIGHLQANKARRAVLLFDVIHSLDSSSLARRLDRLCEEEGRDSLPVLLQVDLGNEPAKSGVREDDVPELVRVVTSGAHLRLIGLMTLPPFFDDPGLARPYFRRLRELRDALRSRVDFGTGGGELSMGMSHDYQIAIEEGATMVRVGTAIFGARLAPPRLLKKEKSDG
jgi:pyridoxal phosphate enzyme (YggS family)